MGDEPAQPLGLEATATLHGAYRWVERRLWQLTAQWAAAQEASAEVRVHLFEMSARHAWHAELWAARLPVLAGADPDALTRPAGPVLEPLLDALGAEGTGPGTDPGPGTGPFHGDERRWLAGLYRVVLPRLLTAYRRHLRAVPSVSHGPTARALSLVVRDEEEQLAVGESLLQGLLRTAADVEVVAATQRALELLVVDAAAGASLVPWSEGQNADVGLRPIQPT